MHKGLRPMQGQIGERLSLTCLAAFLQQGTIFYRVQKKLKCIPCGTPSLLTPGQKGGHLDCSEADKPLSLISWRPRRNLDLWWLFGAASIFVVHAGSQKDREWNNMSDLSWKGHGGVSQKWAEGGTNTKGIPSGWSWNVSLESQSTNFTDCKLAEYGAQGMNGHSKDSQFQEDILDLILWGASEHGSASNTDEVMG